MPLATARNCVDTCEKTAEYLFGSKAMLPYRWPWVGAEMDVWLRP